MTLNYWLISLLNDYVGFSIGWTEWNKRNTHTGYHLVPLRAECAVENKILLPACLFFPGNLLLWLSFFPPSHIWKVSSSFHIQLKFFPCPWRYLWRATAQKPKKMTDHLEWMNGDDEETCLMIWKSSLWIPSTTFRQRNLGTSKIKTNSRALWKLKHYY